jgi:hypothetical protein
MTRPSLIDLGFDLETLSVDAAATVRALCEQFEPEHAAGLALLLNAGEFVQRTIIGPPGTDPRPHLADIDPALPEGCAEVGWFDDVIDLATRLTDLGWPMTVAEVWDDADEDTFTDSGRTVLAITLDRTLRVSAAAPGEHPPRTALIERGQYLACATGEKLHFTDALCRLPLDCDADTLDLAAIHPFAIGDHLYTTCTACDAQWTVGLDGDFHTITTGDPGPVWNFTDAEGMDFTACTIACMRPQCQGRISFALP